MGLCTNCGEPLNGSKFTTCDSCRQKRKISTNRKIQKRLDIGACVDCGSTDKIIRENGSWAVK